MGEIIPTEEQLAIIAQARDPRSLLVNALAGAAKTSTLVMMAKKLPLVPTFVGAFNKRIADEMAQRMPGHIVCKTMNAVGHRVWGDALGKKLIVNMDKTYTLLGEIRDRQPLVERREISESFAAIMRGSRLAKSAGYVPKKMRELGETLIDSHDLCAMIAQQVDVDPDDWFMHYVDELLCASITESFQGRIDFDDQIYMSTLFQGKYPKYPILMIDEAQDLSPLNHRTLEKMYDGRLIAVGDPFQAIYGFRGAHHNSMAELRTRFSMHELTLSTTFRCPRSVVKNAHWRVPHMRYPDWAVEGAVTRLEEWSASSVPDGAAILCRANAPIFACAMRLIRAGRGVKIVGSDIGKGLVILMRKLGPGDLRRDQYLSAVDQWEEDQLKKSSELRRAAIFDRAECLRVFADYGSNLDEFIAYANHLFSASGPIQLMTGHKAKGGEWDTVFHLDPWRVPSKWAKIAAEAGDPAQMEQELNLRYVIETRAKSELFLVNLEDFL